MPATDSRDRCNQRHAEAAKPCEESPQPAARNAAGPSTPTRQSGATAFAATSPAIGLSDRGLSYPAQQESLATSLSKVCAASLSPSTVVR